MILQSFCLSLWRLRIWMCVIIPSSKLPLWCPMCNNYRPTDTVRLSLIYTPLFTPSVRCRVLSKILPCTFEEINRKHPGYSAGVLLSHRKTVSSWAKEWQCHLLKNYLVHNIFRERKSYKILVETKTVRLYSLFDRNKNITYFNSQ